MRRIGYLLLCIMAGPAMVYAADKKGSPTTVVGGMDFGFKKLTLTVGSKGGGGGTYTPFYVTVNPNVAVAFGSFYVGLSHDRAISADPAPEARGSGGSNMLFSRSDTTFTLGYRLSGSFNVFTGYARGENKVNQTTFESSMLNVTDISYTESGPFVGASYTKPFEKGSLSISAAYATLTGKLHMVHYTNTTRVDISEGDNTGFSYGATWSGPLTGSMGYRVGFKATKYEMGEGPKNPQKITERYNSIFIGIQNYF